MTNLRKHHPKDNAIVYEFDAVLEIKHKVFLLETKYTVRSEYVERLPQLIQHFKECFPNYADKELVTIFASMKIHESTLKRLTKNQKMITSLDQLNDKKRYTYSDYILWQFKERVELLKGYLFPMAAPNVRHQKISGTLYLALGNFLLNKQCDIFSAPFDVRLPLSANRIKGDKIDTVVQPDLCVICDKAKLDKQGCIGAPDLIIEILSPGNSKREMKDKYELYQEAGVLEYWVVDPVHDLTFAYYLDVATHKFVPTLPVLTDEDFLESKLFEGLKIDLSRIFPEEIDGGS